MSEVTKMSGPVRGYKVFYSNWTCRPAGAKPKQYTCPGKFEEEGEIEICGHGMHFCTRLLDCFNYYSFNPENKVAEVVAYGDIKQMVKNRVLISLKSYANFPGKRYYRLLTQVLIIPELVILEIAIREIAILAIKILDTETLVIEILDTKIQVAKTMEIETQETRTLETVT